MIYELRTYEALPGRMPALNKRFADHTLALFAKHGFRVIGFWTADVGSPSNELIYMLAWESAEERDRCWATFRVDPDWVTARDASEKDGPIVNRVTNSLLRPTPYYPKVTGA